MTSLPPLERLLCELIAVPSLAHDRNACAIALNICRNCLDELPGVEIRQHMSKDQPSLVALYKANRTPDIMLVCHVDVVPGPASAFAPEVIDGKVFGRGAIDMKGPTSALIRAFHRYVSRKPATSVGLMISTDEEVGGRDGVQYLMQTERYRCKCAILPDAGYDFKLVKLQYGILRIRVRRKGMAAHSSRPEEGNNAIENFLESFRSFKRRLKKIPRTVSNLAMINGGIAMNVVPDLCEARIDIRTANLQRVKDMIRDSFDTKEFEIIAEEPAFHIDGSHPYIRLYKRVAQKELKRGVKLHIERGATDARFLVHYKIPVIVSGPKGGGHHQDSEWVDLESLKQCENIVLKFLSEFR